CPEVEQDPASDSVVLAREAEQEVLGADVVVAERERLAQTELEHLLRAWRERDLAGRDFVTLADDAPDLAAHPLQRYAERLEDVRAHALLLAQEPEQEVLRPDVVVLQVARLDLRQHDDLTRSLGEALEHLERG